MKYFDTSALLRAWKEGWVPRSGITRTHTLAEWFHIQSGRGLVYRMPNGREEKRALSWPLAASEARRMVANLTFVDLSAAQVMDALEELAGRPGLKAGAIHDYLHVRAAELHKASTLVTLNLVEWSKLTRKRLELPAKHPPAR